jgi:hypothetical protein
MELFSAIHNVDWEICGAAMKSLSLSHRRWTSKNASENCGVGSTLLYWGKQDHAACPRCGAPETTLHVQLCRAENSDAPWNKSYSTVEEYLTEMDTHPSIQMAILHRLHQFRHGENMQSLPPLLTAEIKQSVLAQDKIGWKNFLEGLPAKQWRISQERHYRRLSISNRNGKRWMKGLLHHLHLLAWTQWDHRNQVLHHPDLKIQRIARGLLHRHIAAEYSRGRDDLPPRDHSHFNLPLIALLDKSLTYKKAWIVNVTSARHQQARRRAEAVDIRATTRERSAVEKWCLTGRLS